MFFHNIDITVCTENSGIANGKQDIIICRSAHANEWHKEKRVYSKNCWERKRQKICTAKVNSNNCNKFIEDAARHTLLLKNSKNNIKNC